jgi:hypothetical protein
MKYIQGGLIKMALNFEEIKTKFINADLDEKIRIYTTTEGLSVEQFRELLKYYPIQHLSKLEKALG